MNTQAPAHGTSHRSVPAPRPSRTDDRRPRLLPTAGALARRAWELLGSDGPYSLRLPAANPQLRCSRAGPLHRGSQFRSSRQLSGIRGKVRWEPRGLRCSSTKWESRRGNQISVRILTATPGPGSIRDSIPTPAARRNLRAGRPLARHPRGLGVHLSRRGNSSHGARVALERWEGWRCGRSQSVPRAGRRKNPEWRVIRPVDRSIAPRTPRVRPNPPISTMYHTTSKQSP